MILGGNTCVVLHTFTFSSCVNQRQYGYTYTKILLYKQFWYFSPLQWRMIDHQPLAKATEWVCPDLSPRVLLNHNTVSRNLYHILLLIPLRPFIPFLTPHLILHNQILQPVLHLYIVITHCIFPIPTFWLYYYFSCCYTVILFTYIRA